MFKLLRNTVAVVMVLGGTLGLLAMASSSISAFEVCTGVYNCYLDRDCDEMGVCDTCVDAAFPVMGHCRMVTEN